MKLSIKNLKAEVGGKEILKGLDLEVGPGEVHAIMGPNGSGKSTLAHVLAGRPGFEVTAGAVIMDGESLIELEPEERARGTIPNSVHAPRGFIEFIADPAGPMHNPAFASGKKLVLFCGTGARSAMAAKTLMEMGFGDVANMVGGFQAWTQAGGAVAR